MDMDNTSNLVAYRRLAPWYDLVMGEVFEDGRKRAMERLACQPGDKVLELGVGTGLALPLYPAGVEVLGVDLSESMLARARRRMAHLKLQHKEVVCMDAMDLKLPDASFDKVTALYIASVVPDPQRMIREMKRVCKPGGDLLMVNHFSSYSKAGQIFERFIAPICPSLGFRPDLELQPLLKQADWEGAHIERVNAFGYWRLIHARNV
jgi:phosphatidylethanolamine/phosphatidyl-N-methylethanolamine N-methyltransferase